VNLFVFSNFIPDDSVPSILHGIGTFAIQIAKHLGIKVFVTAGLFTVMEMIL